LKIEPGITPVSIPAPRNVVDRRKLLSSRHLRGNIRKENLRCAREEQQDKRGQDKKEEEQRAFRNSVHCVIRAPGADHKIGTTRKTMENVWQSFTCVRARLSFKSIYKVATVQDAKSEMNESPLTCAIGEIAREINISPEERTGSPRDFGCGRCRCDVGRALRNR